MTWAVPHGCIPEVHGSWHFCLCGPLLSGKKILKIVFYHCVDITMNILIFISIKTHLYRE